jgi:hypothetical protein
MTLPLLVPLEWPIQHPSAVAYLVLLVLGPVVIAGIITIIGLVPTWRRSLDHQEPTAEVGRSDS